MNRGRGQRSWRTLNEAALARRAPALPSGQVGIGRLHQRGMNRVERDYASELEARRQRREIQWWSYGDVKLRLADNTFYEPDFLVMGIGGEIEIHETKGRSGDGYWCREDAKIKVKCAAERFPFRFKIVWPKAGGGWDEEAF